MRSLFAPSDRKHKVSGSLSLPSRGPFHLSLTVLFAIGHWVVFRLGRRSSRFQTGFHVSGPTPDTCQHLLISPTGVLPSSRRLSSRLRLSSNVSYRSIPQVQAPGLASFPFARRYLENRCFFLFLRLLRCFSSPRSPSHGYLTHHGVPAYCSRWVPPFGNLRLNGYLLLT